MSLSIASNISALDSQRSLGIAQRNLAGNMAHLSSGMRINGAADDAAGLAISEQMGADIKSYSQAQRNANDGVSMMQVADGAMSQQAALLTRMKELATQAANDTNGTAQRADADTEYQQLAKEVDRISASTQFNGTAMLASSTTVQFQVGTGANTTNDQISVTVAKTDT
ncbi:MAG: flagellin N-terminal helical domain-containing protein, partial [Polyangia bacterium]